MSDEEEIEPVKALASVNQFGHLEKIPPIRDNPLMSFSEERRPSVANPHSITILDLESDGSSSNESVIEHKSITEETESEIDSNNESKVDTYQKTDDLPSIEEEYVEYTRSHVLLPTEVEDSDPFAHLGRRQMSVMNRELSQLSPHPTADDIPIDFPMNEFSPQNLLSEKSLRKWKSHSTIDNGDSRRSRSARTAINTHGRNATVMGLKSVPLSGRKKYKKRAHSRSMSSRVIKSSGPPKGPNISFVCTRIINRSQFQNGLHNSQLMQLMHTHDTIVTHACEMYGGYIAEHHKQHIFDFFLVFDNICDAVRCAINIQCALNEEQWPAFYQEFEKSQKLKYNGFGPSDSFHGLRVAMAVHSAIVGSCVNPYDDGMESLMVSDSMLFDKEYKGTAIQMCKAICAHTFGGEMLASKSVAESILLSRQMNDEISVHSLGIVTVDEELRDVELLQIIPNEMAHRRFTEHYTFINRKYDPFPTTVNINTEEHSSDDEPEVHPHITEITAQRRNSLTQYRMESENIEVLFMPVTDDVSIPSPTNKSRRNKAQEIIRRKSGLNMIGANIRSVSKLKRRRTIHESAADHSSASEVDEKACQLQSKPKAPTRNKKAEMQFIRAGTHSRTGSPRSSVGSMNSSKRRKYALVNTKQQLIYHEHRPHDLPRNYKNEDEEFMCLCCQKLKRWDNGVWRCAMWNNFDICDDCARNELTQGKTRVQSTFPKHRLSEVPLMDNSEQPKETEMNIHEEHQVMIDSIRRSLSLVIETLNIEVCNRLDNIKSISKDDQRMQHFYIQSDEDFKQCENEISEWRKLMAIIDEQEERLKRRSRYVLLTNDAGRAYSPTPTELESDEELFANLKEYDYSSDFSFINRKLSLVNDLFWREDALLKQMQANFVEDAKAECMDIEEQYKITIDDLEQQCLDAQQKLSDMQLNVEYEDSEKEFNDNKYERYALKRYEHNEDGISLEQFELAIHEIKLKYESQIDNYIEQFARKDAQYQDAQQQILQLSSEMSTEEIYHQLQDEKQMNAKLQQELNTLKETVYFPVSPNIEIINDPNAKPVDDVHQSFHDVRDEMVNSLTKENKDLKVSVENITHSKLQFIIEASMHMEQLRDEITSNNEEIVILRQLNLQLVQNKDYVEGNEGSHLSSSPSALIAKQNTSYLHSISNKASGFLSYGRSKFSMPLWKSKLQHTEESKIALAKSTAAEMERLRSMIRCFHENQKRSKNCNK